MGSIRSVMYFVDNPQANCEWWVAYLAPGSESHGESGGFWWFDLAGVEIGFHPSDDGRNSTAGASPVVYYSVDNLDQRRAELLAAGCTHHRGPLGIAPGRPNLPAQGSLRQHTGP